MNVKMERVSSSNIAEIGYDDSSQLLYVRFLNSTLYVYKNVPDVEFQSFKNAPSLGSYLNRSIKNSYPYERLE